MNNNWRWAVVGNIQQTRIDENGILRYGTPAFKGNARVYLCGRLWDERLPNISVCGLTRGHQRCVKSVPIELIKNVRLTRVYQPGVLEIMSNFEFCECWWGNTQEERDDAAAFVQRWNETYKTE